MKRRIMLLKSESETGPVFLIASREKLNIGDRVKLKRDGTVEKAIDGLEDHKCIGYVCNNTQPGGFTPCRIYGKSLPYLEFFFVAER